MEPSILLKSHVRNICDMRASCPVLQPVAHREKAQEPEPRTQTKAALRTSINHQPRSLASASQRYHKDITRSKRVETAGSWDRPLDHRKICGTLRAIDAKSSTSLKRVLHLNYTLRPEHARTSHQCSACRRHQNLCESFHGPHAEMLNRRSNRRACEGHLRESFC